MAIIVGPLLLLHFGYIQLSGGGMFEGSTFVPQETQMLFGMQIRVPDRDIYRRMPWYRLHHYDLGLQGRMLPPEQPHRG